MLKRLYINNFKTLVDFHLPAKEEPELAQFTCLIGLNGAGKSTLLQAFDFLSQLMRGRVKDWLQSRDWEPRDLTSRLAQKRSPLINFELEVALVLGVGPLKWTGSFNTTLMRCTSEVVTSGEEKLLELADGKLLLNGVHHDIEWFQFEGSVISLLKHSASEVHLVSELWRFMQSLKSLDLLSPHLMRKRAREAEDVGFGGERLGAFIAGFSSAGKQKLVTGMQQFYPHLVDITTPASKGWKSIRFFEKYGTDSTTLQTDAKQLNDGALRILALLAQTMAEPGLSKLMRADIADLSPEQLGSLSHREYRTLLFDEIENGINPELIQKLADYLRQAPQQIITTTHSPLILNYLPDDQARQTVVLLYRNAQGLTRAKRFFSIERMSKKLGFMGAGEAFADTSMEALVAELNGTAAL